ncbi:MAG: shikimate dehydrogenase [Sphingomonadales bacterium]|nr:shikimate dehydrogenase [Sphingomonadales bacterium]MDE2568705.1 shikimate dehydrogenase [Sphingomonadales bacterium]
MYKCGLIGRSILASRSPWLHEQEGRAQGLDLTYELFDFTDRGWDDDELGPLLRRLAAEGYRGVNVTFPFKQAVIPLLDELDESAAAVGAVNTVQMRGGKLTGYNTDMAGFREGLVAGLPLRKMDRVLLVGAGGAGAAVANALLTLGDGTLGIADRDPGRASALVAQLSQRYGPDRVSAVTDADEALNAADGIVNATPMGMASKPGSPVDTGKLQPRQWVADIVYFPLETELLRGARDLGCPAVDGSGMVIGQAARAFEIFTGHAADIGRMRASFSAKT